MYLNICGGPPYIYTYIYIYIYIYVAIPHKNHWFHKFRGRALRPTEARDPWAFARDARGRLLGGPWTRSHGGDMPHGIKMRQNRQSVWKSQFFEGKPLNHGKSPVLWFFDFFCGFCMDLIGCWFMWLVFSCFSCSILVWTDQYFGDGVKTLQHTA